MFLQSKNIDAAILHPKRLHAFENGLAIMQRYGGGRKADVAIRNNGGRAPFTIFKVFFSWAMRRQYIKSNPLAAFKRPNVTSSRERVLTESEACLLLRHTLSNRNRFNDIVSLLLLTGQRKFRISQIPQ